MHTIHITKFKYLKYSYYDLSDVLAEDKWLCISCSIPQEVKKVAKKTSNNRTAYDPLYTHRQTFIKQFIPIDWSSKGLV